MRNCPQCNQELATFFFYCPRCGSQTGCVDKDGVMIATYWVDAGGQKAKKCLIKTLKRGPDYLDLESVSSHQPSKDTSVITFIVSNRASAQRSTRVISQSLTDFYAQASSTSQEWEVS